MFAILGTAAAVLIAAAIVLFAVVLPKLDLENKPQRTGIAIGERRIVAVGTDGRVLQDSEMPALTGKTAGWTDIVAVSAGLSHTVGLKSNGTVVAVGENVSGECNVSEWRDIIAVSAGIDCTIGLKKDGTVVACESDVTGQCDVSDWRDIAAICATDNRNSISQPAFTVGLKRDRTVVRTGFTYRRALQNEGSFDVSQWTGIAAIDAGCGRILGLKKDVSLVICGVSHLFDVSEMSHVYVP